MIALTSILFTFITGFPLLTAQHVILLIGVDLLLSESLFNIVAQIEDFQHNSNYSINIQATVTFILTSLMFMLTIYPEGSYFKF